MVDDVHVDRHPLVLGEQVGDADRRDGDRGVGVHGVPTAATVAREPDNGAVLPFAVVYRSPRRIARRELIAGAMQASTSSPHIGGSPLERERPSPLATDS